MGTIKRVGRGLGDPAPQLTAKITRDIGAPIREGAEAMAGAKRQMAGAIGKVADEYTDRLERHREAKRKELVDDVYFEDFDDSELEFQDFLTKKEVAGQDRLAEYDDMYQKRLGEIEKQLGGDREAFLAYRQRSDSDHKIRRRQIAKRMVTDREVAKETGVSRMLASRQKSIGSNPDPEALDAYIAQMHQVIDAQGYDSAKADEAKGLSTQALTESYLRSIGPEEAMALLDNKKMGFRQKFINAEEVDNFRKVLEVKADTQRKQAEREREKAQDKKLSDIVIALNKGEAVDSFALFEDPAFKDDPKALQAALNVVKGYNKETKKEKKEEQYRGVSENLLLDKDVSVVDIINSVDDPKDREHLINLRDEMQTNKLIKSDTYKQVQKSLADDHKNNMFGEGDEGTIEYLRQRRDFEQWAMDNPEGDPTEYYEKLMEPYEATRMQKVLDWVPFVNFETRDPAKRRQEISQKKPSQNEFLERARAVNPDKSDKELLDYYQRTYGR